MKLPPQTQPRPLKLAFVIKGMAGSGGGAERVLADVLHSLCERGHAITLFTSDPAGSASFYPLDPRIDWVRTGIGTNSRPSRIGETVQRARHLRRELVALAPDVVVGFMHSSYIPLAFALAGTGLPLVASEHIIGDHYRTVPLQGLLLRLALPRLAAITVVSDQALGTFPPAIARRSTVIANPVKVHSGSLANVLAPGPRRVLSVGRLNEQKDHATLIAAFARTLEAFPAWTLRIVGDGDLRPQLERQITAANAAERIVLAGSTTDIDAEYSAAQLFALSSSYESFGLVTAEALSHGLPAIGFADCPGTNTLIRSGINGLLVAGEDRVESMAAGLARLMGDDSLRGRLAAAAPESVKFLDSDMIGGQWDQLLRRVARHSPS